MMLYNERAEVILQQLQLQSTVKVGELSQLLQVSIDTIRRDLKSMEQSGLLKCVRGGPVSDYRLGRHASGDQLFRVRDPRYGRRRRYRLCDFQQPAGLRLWYGRNGHSSGLPCGLLYREAVCPD